MEQIQEYRPVAIVVRVKYYSRKCTIQLSDRDERERGIFQKFAIVKKIFRYFYRCRFSGLAIQKRDGRD